MGSACLSDAPIIWCVALCRALAVQATGHAPFTSISQPKHTTASQYNKKETKQESKQETRDAAAAGQIESN